jgi:hypothetical protein
MSFHTSEVIILIPHARLAQANTYLERNGYGPDNFKIPLILKSDADNRDPPRGWGLMLSADMGLIALAKKVLAMDVTNVKILFGPKARRRAKQFLDENNLRIRPGYGE